MSEAISWFEEVWPMIKKTRVSYITPHIDVALYMPYCWKLEKFC